MAAPFTLPPLPFPEDALAPVISSLVVIAATLNQFNIPEAGLLLILGIDTFLDMGRSATNAVGNSIATAVVAKWEGALGETYDEEALEIEEEELLAMPAAVAE